MTPVGLRPCPSFLLRCYQILFSWCVYTNLIFSVSGMLTFGIVLYDLVSDMALSCLPLSTVYPHFCYMQSVLVFLSNRPTLFSICHCWLDHRPYTASFSLMGTFVLILLYILGFKVHTRVLVPVVITNGLRAAPAWVQSPISPKTQHLRGGRHQRSLKSSSSSLGSRSVPWLG